jgi:hypothetical protein
MRVGRPQRGARARHDPELREALEGRATTSLLAKSTNFWARRTILSLAPDGAGRPILPDFPFAASGGEMIPPNFRWDHL